ncbi:MAG: bifunctional heptose 7-phosphate kinase/heptose 1-phosphate adenyltransferase [Pirellulales bacterium]|nr:bifunctional heptose 7-phosphate kinase/heptose 1-phosphate adenyltransferase [Pirellulales bacterium]
MPNAPDFMPLLTRPGGPRILIVGDVILDRYLWGNVERISPEAPIPLLRVVKRESRLGGAGSVAAMLAALDARVSLATAVGQDDAGAEVRSLLEGIGVDTSAVLEVDDRPTTVKERLLGRAQSRHPQQMLRVDFEEDHPLPTAAAEQLLAAVRARLVDVELVLVSDYNKGVCAGDLVPWIVAAARHAGKLVVADPVRVGDYRRYSGCTAITPNRLEASLATGVSIHSPDDGIRAAKALVALGIDSVIVTLDRDGMAWADRQGRTGLFPVRPRDVYDITGAGDMVLSVIGLGLAAGLDFPAVIELANLAGGLEVERLGAVPLSRAELLAEALAEGHSRRSKLLPLAELLTQLERRRRAGQRIVMTNGCFDLLHPGHLSSLETARQMGDCLVVGLNSDRSAAEIKGPTRPIIDEVGRADMLSALACVDYVVLFDEPSVAPLVGQIRPDILAKSASYGAEEVVGHEIVTAYGGEVRPIPMRGGYSTSALVDKIISGAEAATASNRK